MPALILCHSFTKIFPISPAHWLVRVRDELAVILQLFSTCIVPELSLRLIVFTINGVLAIDPVPVQISVCVLPHDESNSKNVILVIKIFFLIY